MTKKETAEKGIRLLREDEIECRVAQINEKGLSLLLYKDARVDQRILDETFGMLGWRRSHQEIGGSLYCTVEVFDKETGQWIGKQDVGTEGYTEKEKSLASDSFKRACFNWGIGRELYSAPFIWIGADKTQITDRNGKYICKDSFSVSGIAYNEKREIRSLTITNRRGEAVFTFGRMGSTKSETSAPAKQENRNAVDRAKKMPITKFELSHLRSELTRTGVTMEQVKERYHLDDPEKMTFEVFQRVMKALESTSDAEKAA